MDKKIFFNHFWMQMLLPTNQTNHPLDVKDMTTRDLVLVFYQGEKFWGKVLSKKKMRFKFVVLRNHWVWYSGLNKLHA